MDYTILILALPVLSFLVLALAGMKMPHRVAGALGTLSLGGVAVLSYLTAYNYLRCLGLQKVFIRLLFHGTLNGYLLLHRFILIWEFFLILFRL